MSVVIDASMAIARFPPDERPSASTRVLGLLSPHRGSVPTTFRHEIRNILLVSERRMRATASEVDEIMAGLDELSPDDGGPGDDGVVAAIARAHGLTAYDAASVALALSGGAPLATLDGAMATAARARGLTILGPLAP